MRKKEETNALASKYLCPSPTDRPPPPPLPLHPVWLSSAHRGSHGGGENATKTIQNMDAGIGRDGGVRVLAIQSRAHQNKQKEETRNDEMAELSKD